MLSQKEIITILTDLGLSESWIADFQNMNTQQRQIALNDVRHDLLKDIHHVQDELERLDYLCYKIN